MAKILYGAPVAEALDVKTRTAVSELVERGVQPTLAIVRVGEVPDQVSYERGASKRCASVGVHVRNEVLPTSVGQDELEETLNRLNADRGVHGVLLLQPLPERLDGKAVRDTVAPAKDVDVVSDAVLARVLLGDESSFAPCTPQACIEVLDYYGIELDGKKAVVLGRSLVVGKPVAALLLDRNATVTMCHSHTRDAAALAREADILVAAMGRDHLVGPEYVSSGQVVLDVGINWNEGEQRLHGDVDFEAVEPLVAAITPVPKGIGSVTTSVLISHVVQSAWKALERG